METIPDKWVVIKITKEGKDTIYKVYATFSDDNWRVNSGIMSVEQGDGHLIFIGYSGSRYICKDDCYGLSSYSGWVLSNMINRATEVDAEITILDYDHDFLNLVVAPENK